MPILPLIWLLLGLMVSTPLAAQIDPDELPGGAREQYEAFKVAFFTRRLSLSIEEAKTFWPVYDAYTSDLQQLRRGQRAKQREMRAAFNGSDEDMIERLSDEFIELKGMEGNLRTQYHSDFKRVLPIRKVVLLYKAEQDFKRELLEELRRRRQGRGGRFGQK